MGPASGLHPTLILFVAIRNPGKGRNVVIPLCYQWLLGDVMFPAFPPAEQALQTRVCWGTAELCNIYLMTALQGHLSLGFTQGVVFSRMLIVYLSLFSWFQASQKPQRMQNFLFRWVIPENCPWCYLGELRRRSCKHVRKDCKSSLHMVGRNTSASLWGLQGLTSTVIQLCLLQKGWSVSSAELLAVKFWKDPAPGCEVLHFPAQAGEFFSDPVLCIPLLFSLWVFSLKQ